MTLKTILLCLTIALTYCDAVDPVKFLRTFGYINENAYASDLPNAIMKMQEYAGLPITGKLDAATLAKMKSRRCGRPDIEPTDNAISAAVSKWGKTRLTYSFENYCHDMSQGQCRRGIRDAFSMWERVTPLRFTEIRSGGDITIKFGAGDHGDIYKFDGPNGVLAHAFYPEDGRAHFDEDEKFVLYDGDYSTVNLFWVAAHEFGHSLGLAHSKASKALMNAYYQKFDDTVNLPIDDCQRIQAVYGHNGKRCGTDPGTGACQDDARYQSSCSGWKGLGYCTDPKYTAQMKTFCPKECGFCR